MIALIIDLIAAIQSVFTFGFLGAATHAGTWLLFSFWFTMKGAKATSSLMGRYIIPLAVQAIPVLPTTTATFLVSTYIENNPEKFGLSKAVAPTEKAPEQQ